MAARRTGIKGKKGTRVVPFKAPTPPLLPRYLYVEARGWFTDVITDQGTIRTLDGAISFADRVVRAKDIGDAYNVGAAAMDALKTEKPDHGGSHFTGSFLNDYVVKL